jgi:hypothetical protein
VTISGGEVITVHNLSIDPPATATPGGGLATTLTLPIPGGLAPGAAIAIAFTFDVDHGGTYWFGYDINALTTTNTQANGSARHQAARHRPTSGIIPTRPAKPSRFASGSGTLP